MQSKYIQHWLFHNISKQQFVISWKNQWDILPPIVAPVNGAFTVLADNARAPQVFQRGNAVGVEYHMQDVYPDTIVTLKNFVKYQNTRMQVLLRDGVHYTGSGQLSQIARLCCPRSCRRRVRCTPAHTVCAPSWAF